MPRKTKDPFARIKELINENRVTLEAVTPTFACATIRGSSHDHFTFIGNGRGICSCEGFMYRASCNHIKALQHLTRLEVNQTPKLATFSKNLNTFLDGGIAIGDMTLICGEAANGKTLFAVEIVCDYLANYPEKNVLMIFTEERMKNTLNVLLARYGKKYGLKDIKRAEWILTGDSEKGKPGTSKENIVKKFVIKQDLVEPEILVNKKLQTQTLITAFIPNLYDLTNLIGKPGMFTSPSSDDEKGYQRWIEVGPQETHVQNSILAQFVERYKIGLIVTDSITQPVKTEWVMSQSNFPARASCYTKWLGRYQHICSYFDATIINIGHAVPRGAMDFSTLAEEKVWGGNNVLHCHKYIIRLRRMPRKIDKAAVEDFNTKRRVYIERWGTQEDNRPDEGGAPSYTVIQLTDDGWIDPLEPKVTPKVEKSKEPEGSKEPEKPAKPRRVARKSR